MRQNEIGLQESRREVQEEVHWKSPVRNREVKVGHQVGLGVWSSCQNDGCCVGGYGGFLHVLDLGKVA